jgi:phosphomannomutase
MRRELQNRRTTKVDFIRHRRMTRGFSIGELSFTLENAGGIIKNARQSYGPGSTWGISGLSSNFADWSFVLSAGFTEPMLRLVIEADTKDELEKRRRELVNKIIQKQGDAA